jgi:hypothetical protein
MGDAALYLDLLEQPGGSCELTNRRIDESTRETSMAES